jgi:PhoPQ-activated pathogenicity-related protein
MNINEQVKMYQDCRHDAADAVKKLSSAAAVFYQQLLPVNKFLSMLPNTLAYRKRALQQQSMNVVKIIDNMMHDSKQLDIDCTLQIQSLIAQQKLEKLREEHKNAKSTNARLVRQFSVKRSKANS